MFKKKYILFTVIMICLFTATSTFAKPKVINEYKGEATVKVGDIWQLITPAQFDSTNYDIIERYNNNGVKFTKVGDTVVTGYYRDAITNTSNKWYSQTKVFHVVSSDEYGESIKPAIPENNYAQEILDEINKKRTSAGLNPLIMDKALCNKAYKYAQVVSVNFSYDGGLRYILYGTKPPTIFVDKNYKFIDYTYTFFNNPFGESPSQKTFYLFDNADKNNYSAQLAMDRKARYFGANFTIDTNGTYYWGFLFADKKK